MNALASPTVPRDLRAKVVSNVAIAPLAFELRFEETAAPGSRPELRYEPGEFIQLTGWSQSDPLLRRPMSVLDWGRAPDGRVWASFLYQATGRGTRIFAGLRAGDPIRALGPLGNRFSAPSRAGVALVVAGGVGVAPFLLLARKLRAEGREVVVLLGARDREHLYLEDALAREGARVKTVTEKGDHGGPRGLVTALLEAEIEARGPDGIARVYSCGPEPMLRAVHAVARARGVPGEASLERRMACGFGVCFTCVCPMVDPRTGEAHNRRTCLDGPVVGFDALPLGGF
jgi:dihydroorotate dehydrogenase electron transfer subunit